MEVLRKLAAENRTMNQAAVTLGTTFESVQRAADRGGISFRRGRRRDDTPSGGPRTPEQEDEYQAAKAALRHEIEMAKAERATAPPFKPKDGGF